MIVYKIEKFYIWIRAISIAVAIILLVLHSVLHASFPFEFELNVPELIEKREHMDQHYREEDEREAYEKFCRERQERQAHITQTEIMDFIKRSQESVSSRDSNRDSARGPSGYEGTTLDRGHD